MKSRHYLKKILAFIIVCGLFSENVYQYAAVGEPLNSTSENEAEEISDGLSVSSNEPSENNALLNENTEETVSISQINEEPAGDATEYETGHIPVPMKVPDTYYPDGVEEPAGNLAEKYLPDINTEITSVKNQGQEGLCWAYSAAAVLEQSAIKTGVGNLSTDYDEHQINAGFSSNHKNDPLNLTKDDKAVKTTDGNNNLFTTWLLASQVSPVSQNTPATSGYAERAASLIEAKFIPSNDLTAIKQAILDYGSVAIGIDSTNYNGSNKLTYGYRAKSHYKETHEVTLIGWDDTIDKSLFGDKKTDKTSAADYTTCPSNGGFKFKNSWGSGVGENGYQYISYADNAFSGENTYAIAYKIDQADNFDTVYEYDGSYGTRREYVIKAANFYTAAGNKSENGAEVINKAGFGVYDTGEYIVSIYLNNENKELTNATSGQWFMDDENLVASKKVTASNAGYYTTEFDEPPQIEEGTEFAVVLKKADGSLFQIYTDKTYTNGDWITFTANTANEKKFVVQNNSTVMDSSSFTPRLKVFTKNISTIPPVATDLSTGNVSLGKNKYSYTGSAIEPKVTVKDENGTIMPVSGNYTVSYSDNINAGTGKVMVTAEDGGLCTGSRQLIFTIDPVSLAECQVTGVTDKAYTGSPIEQSNIVVKLNGKTLSKESDYSLSYNGNTDVGNNAQVKIKGKGNYKDEKTVSFSITKAKPTLSNIKATDIMTGQTLASSILSGTAKNGSVNVPGKFAFKNPDVKPSKGTSIQDVIFTPNNQNNYEITTGKASVKVNDPIHVDSVDLDSYNLSLKTGGTYKLTATVKPEDATDKSVTWESSNISVATVDSNGTVTAVSYGKANISAISDGVRSPYCTVSVTDERIPVTSVALNKTTLSLEKGNTDTLTVSIIPDNATVKNVKWASSNPAIAIVSGNAYGIVYALSKGTTDITAVCDGITSNICRVTVTASGEDTPEQPDTPEGPDKPEVPDIPDIPVSGNTPPALGTNIKANSNTDIYLVKGQKYTLDSGYEWKSSDSSIISVAGKYKITAKSRGETSITNNDGKIVYTAHVTDPTLSSKKMTLQSGAQTKLVFNELDNSEKYGVYWYSSNPEVARVKDGLVYAAGKGKATIKAYLNGKAFKCNVKVVETNGITALSDNKYVFKPLQSAKIPAKGFKYNNATWTSSTSLNAVVNSQDKVTGWKNDIVYITKSGKITAIGQGTTDITVKDTNGNELSFTVMVNKPQTHVAFVTVSKLKSWSFYNVKMKKVTWKSSDSAIANIYNGKIAAGSVTGTATVSGNYDPYATGKGFDYTVKVYVEDPKWSADNLTAVSPSKYIMTAAQNKDYKIDSTGIYQGVVFKSSNDAVACIDEYGYLHTGKAGKANITTKINGKTYTVKVNVE